jgi:hypothetical protein
MQILSLTSALVKTVDIANSIYIIKETVPEFNFLTDNRTSRSIISYSIVSISTICKGYDNKNDYVFTT